MFGRISLITSLSVTNKDTFLGQIDVNLITVDEIIYEIWGLRGDCPSSLIGECKNYKSAKVSRPGIKKSCWRAGKGGSLSFFIRAHFSKDAVKEIGYFNNYKESIFVKSKGIYLIPLTIDILDIIISNNLNFYYFIP